MIGARIRQIAADGPDKPALMGGGRFITYAELLGAAARFERLLEQRGIQPGDFVVASLPIGLEAVASFFACADLGAVFLPVNPAWRQPELSWLLEQVAPSSAIVLRGDAQRWLESGLARERMVFTDEPDWPGTQKWEEFPGKQWPREHPAAAIVSSGSMGRPKIAVKTQSGITDVAACMGAACSIGPGNRLLATVPMHHGSGLANNLVLPLLNGAALVSMERLEPSAAAELIERFSVDYLISSPVFYTLMIDAQIAPPMLRSLRVCLSTGAPFAASVRDEWRRRCGAPIRQAYGSSDAGMISVQSEDSADSRFIGHPVAMTDVRIVAGEEEAACGQTGEIAVRGPGVVTRYLGTSEETAIRFWNGYLLTGDLGCVDGNGRLYLFGRVRPWINYGGMKVDPLEVQQALGCMPGIRECLVEAEKDSGGRDIVAAVIASEPGVELTRAKVIQHCRSLLAEYKIPRVVRFVPALATDPTGKSAKHWS